MHKYGIPFIFVLLNILSGCTLVDYESTKNESPPQSEAVVQNNSSLEARILELEKRVKELEDKLKAKW